MHSRMPCWGFTISSVSGLIKPSKCSYLDRALCGRIIFASEATKPSDSLQLSWNLLGSRKGTEDIVPVHVSWFLMWEMSVNEYVNQCKQTAVTLTHTEKSFYKILCHDGNRESEYIIHHLQKTSLRREWQSVMKYLITRLEHWLSNHCGQYVYLIV